MKRFRALRRRRAALALLPAIAITMTIATSTAAAKPNPGADAASLQASTAKAEPGARIKLRGRFPAPRVEPDPEATTSSQRTSEQRIRIEFRPAGKRKWRFVTVAGSDKKGRYAKTVKVRRSGFFRALHPDGRVSDADRVRVKSTVKAHLSGGDALVGDEVTVKGSVQPTISRRRVVVSIGGEQLQTRTGASGRFRVKWRADGVGTTRATVKAKGDAIAAGSSRKAGKATVYRPALASWYGPGLYGNGVACGGTLSPSTIGVAHKTLPCGTKVRLRLGNRKVVARVIDRGPYTGGREFDLTEAVKNRLGFQGVGNVYVDR